MRTKVSTKGQIVLPAELRQARPHRGGAEVRGRAARLQTSTGYAASRRSELERWFERGVGRIECLAWDATVGLRWARLLADLRRRGKPMSVKDSLIAATALAHDLALATSTNATSSGPG